MRLKEESFREDKSFQEVLNSTLQVPFYTADEKLVNKSKMNTSLVKHINEYAL